MRALVTRPREDAEGVAQELARRGFEVLTEPLLHIAPITNVAVPLEGAQAILATSANGVRALAAATTERDLPVLAVGNASARCARELGFRTVSSADGDADSLVALVKSRLRRESGALIHAAGTAVAGDISGALAAAGYDLRRIVLYRAETAEALSTTLIAALREGTIDLALFFSPRTAATFARLARLAGVAESCSGVAAYCLSDAVANRLCDLPWRHLRTAAHPDQSALLAAIDEDFDVKTSSGGEARV